MQVSAEFHNSFETCHREPAMCPVMIRPTEQRVAASRLRLEGTFVIQLRSNSNIEEGRVSGRVEHVMSGQSVQFTSLDRLLAFMALCAPPPAGEGENST